MNKRSWIYGYILLIAGGCGIGIQAVLYIHQSSTFSWRAGALSLFSIGLGFALSNTALRAARKP